MLPAAGYYPDMDDPVQSAVWRVDPEQAVWEVMTMDDWVTRRVSGFRVR